MLAKYGGPAGELAPVGPNPCGLDAHYRGCSGLVAIALILLSGELARVSHGWRARAYSIGWNWSRHEGSSWMRMHGPSLALATRKGASSAVCFLWRARTLCVSAGIQARCCLRHPAESPADYDADSIQDLAMQTDMVATVNFAGHLKTGQ